MVKFYKVPLTGSPNAGRVGIAIFYSILFYLRNDTREGHSYCRTPIGTRMNTIESDLD